MSNNIFRQQDSFSLDNQNYPSLTNFFNFNNDSNISYNNQQSQNQAQNYHFEYDNIQNSFQNINNQYMDEENQSFCDNKFYQQLNHFDSNIYSENHLFTNIQHKHKDSTLLQQIQQEKSSDHSLIQNLQCANIQSYLDLLQKNMCLRTTSIQDIHSFLKNNINLQKMSNNFTDKNYKDIIKQVIKKKLILKRQKAKNRNNSNVDAIKQQCIQFNKKEKPQKKNYSIKNKRQGNCYIDQQKRKRNRISAQVSRDRRKNYLDQLQKNNLIMKQQQEKMRKQNQRLKMELQVLKKQKKSMQSSFKNQSEKNFDRFNLSKNSRLMKILIFMGIMLLISTVKNVISPQKNTFFNTDSFNSLNINKNNDSSFSYFQDKIHQSLNNDLIQYPQQEKFKLVEETSDLLTIQFQNLSIGQKFQISQEKRKKKRTGKKRFIQQESQLIKVEDILLKQKSNSLIPKSFNPVQVTSQIANYIYYVLPNIKNSVMIPRSLFYRIRQIINYFQ